MTGEAKAVCCYKKEVTTMKMKIRNKAEFTDAVTPLEKENAQVSYEAALEGIVLLENDGILPITPGKVALYGAGADMTINPGKENALDKIMNLTDDYGCDIYIEAAGHPSSVIQGLQMIRKLGTFVEFGVYLA